MRVLAIDYGRKRIGIALSDPMCIFPSIIEAIPNDEKVYKNLSDIISKNNVNRIVLGFPNEDNRKLSSFGEEILRFKNKLEIITAIQIVLWDEHFTSKIAEERIIQSVTKKSKRRDKSLVDAHSAAIILEEYLKLN